MQFLSGETYTGAELLGKPADHPENKKLYLVLGKTTDSVNAAIQEVFTREQMAKLRVLVRWPLDGITEPLKDAETGEVLPLVFLVNDSLPQ